MSKFKKYKFQTKIEIAWGDMDAFGHVNNVSYLKYFETARAKYFSELSLWSSHGVTVSSGAMVLTNIDVNYRKQIRFPHTLVVTISIVSMSLRGFTINCTMWNEADECVLDAKAQLVWFNFSLNKISSLPQQFKEVVSAFEGI